MPPRGGAFGGVELRGGVRSICSGGVGYPIGTGAGLEYRVSGGAEVNIKFFNRVEQFVIGMGFVIGFPISCLNSIPTPFASGKPRPTKS